ncbi:hypothetical protein BH09SUM1_BH09SUM1_10770 [soil metagenome]
MNQKFYKNLAAIFFLLIVLTTIYTPVVRFPFFSQSYIEVDMHQRPIAPYFMKGAYLEEVGVYYRPGWRVVDCTLSNLMGGRQIAGAMHLLLLGAHLLCVALLYLLVYQRTRGSTAAAFLVALILSVHPSISGTVVWVSSDWAMWTSVALLIILNAYQYVFNSPESRWAPAIACVTPVLLFFMALIAEMGVLCMGIVGLWVIWEVWRTRSRKMAFQWLVPIAPVPVLLMALRYGALKNFLKGNIYADMALIERLGRPRVWMYNFVYDLSVVLNPIHFSFFDVDVNNAYSVAVSALAGFILVASVIIAIIKFLPTRDWFLPLVAVIAYALFQLNAVWLFVKPPISQSGIDRSYLYYILMIFLLLPVGSAIARFRETKGETAVWLATILIAAYSFFAIGALRDGVRAWQAGAELMNKHRQYFEASFKDVPENSNIYMTGFPDKYTQPYLPVVFLYDQSYPSILKAWTGKSLQVHWQSWHPWPSSLSN